MHTTALPQPRFQNPNAAEHSAEDVETERLAEADKKAAQKEALYLAGRLIMSAVFIISAIVKGAAFDPATAGNLGSLFWLSIIIELVCGAMLGIGLAARKASTVLLLWIGVGIVFFHGDLSVEVNRVFALANLGIAGGLFVFIANGAGLLSVDRLLADKREANEADAALAEAATE